MFTFCFVLVVSGFGQKDEVDSISANYWTAVEKATDSISKIDAIYNLAVHIDENGDLRGSTKQMERALQVALNINDHEWIGKIGNYLATNYLMQGSMDSSTRTYELALSHAELTDDYSQIAKISMNLAENYNFSGNYKNAIKYGLNSLKIKESEGDWERICYHYMAMSNIFKETEDQRKREEYIKLAYAKKDEEGCASVSDIAKIYNGLGGVAQQRLQYEKALAYYDTLKTFCEENGFKQGINTALINSALIYQENGEYETALELVVESDDYADQTMYDSIFSDNCKADLYLSLNKPDLALNLAVKNINREELEYYSAERLKSLKFLYEANFRLKNFDEAYRWNDSLHVYQDSIRNEDVRTAIADLEMQYQTDKKEQQITLLQAENQIRKQERIVYLSISLVLLLFFALGTLLYFKNKRENEMHLLQLRQQLLRSQMNPHFLFNALGSIQNFMYKNETKKAASYLGNFARLTRSILEQSGEEFILLSDEISLLENYLKLEQIRGKNNFSYAIEVDEDMDAEFVKIPPMMVQPFVENAIKHGIRNIDYNGELLVSFRELDDELHVVVRDNGVGINTMQEKEKQSGVYRSMSMKIFKERQVVLSRKYKKQILFFVTDLSETESPQSGTEVKIIIPL
ncbi:histidine kinase [uncultured Draconibacterium sp.]|uniref:histidine kinase n=1 Tax=uncultured Draconibacterium sp. TaxID=1573823 RepID=UPI002AA6E70D|nr:histidine kinase [uncultured Draconibacterium sp.]